MKQRMLFIPKFYSKKLHLSSPYHCNQQPRATAPPTFLGHVACAPPRWCGLGNAETHAYHPHLFTNDDTFIYPSKTGTQLVYSVLTGTVKGKIWAIAIAIAIRRYNTAVLYWQSHALSTPRIRRASWMSFGIVVTLLA